LLSPHISSSAIIHSSHHHNAINTTHAPIIIPKSYSSHTFFHHANQRYCSVSNQPLHMFWLCQFGLFMWLCCSMWSFLTLWKDIPQFAENWQVHPYVVAMCTCWNWIPVHSIVSSILSQSIQNQRENLVVVTTLMMIIDDRGVTSHSTYIGRVASDAYKSSKVSFYSWPLPHISAVVGCFISTCIFAQYFLHCDCDLEPGARVYCWWFIGVSSATLPIYKSSPKIAQQVPYHQLVTESGNSDNGACYCMSWWVYSQLVCLAWPIMLNVGVSICLPKRQQAVSCRWHRHIADMFQSCLQLG
jgi:hypothetical protein